MNRAQSKSITHKRTLSSIIMPLFISLAVLLVIIGSLAQSTVAVYAGILTIFIIYIRSYLNNTKSNVLILIFCISFFIFLLGRFLVRSIYSIPMDVGRSNTLTALTLVFISFLSTNIFYNIYKPKNLKRFIDYGHNTSRIKTFSIIGLVISLIFACLVNVAAYISVLKNGYTSLYLSTPIGLPNMIIAIANLTPIFLAMYLATLPSKKNTYLAIIAYVATLIPLLIAGRRLPVMLALLFWISYVLLRKFKAPRNEEWLGNMEKLALVILIPSIIIAVPFIGDRRGNNYQNGNPLVRTLDSQGITLDVISQGIRFQYETPKSIYRSYTLAPVLDYMSTNYISRTLFQTKFIKPQTEQSALKGISYADTISYLSLDKTAYYAGQGLGSSYIIELFIDFGIFGVLVYSSLLGLLIKWMSNNFVENYFKTFIILLLILEIYALPRSTASGFLVSIFQIQTVMLIGSIFLYDKFLTNYTSFKQ